MNTINYIVYRNMEAAVKAFAIGRNFTDDVIKEITIEVLSKHGVHATNDQIKEVISTR